MTATFEILPVDLLDAYKTTFDIKELTNSFENLTDAEISTDTFSFYTSVASVFSSKIEGEEIELNPILPKRSMTYTMPIRLPKTIP